MPSHVFVSFCKQLQPSQETFFHDNQRATAFVDGIIFQQIFAEVGSLHVEVVATFEPAEPEK